MNNENNINNQTSDVIKQPTSQTLQQHRNLTSITEDDSELKESQLSNSTITIIRCVTGFNHSTFHTYYEVFIYFAIFFIPGGLISTCYMLLVKSFRRNAQYFSSTTDNTANSSSNPNNSVTETRYGKSFPLPPPRPPHLQVIDSGYFCVYRLMN